MAKKAVLIGLNYPGTPDELKGCVNDVWRMHRCLVDRLGFSPDDINVLIDTDPFYTQPTADNIIASLDQLVESAEPGDSLFVYYSGHGFRAPVSSDKSNDPTGFDECIVPSDNFFLTDEFFKNLVCNVPEGCKLTMLSDSCHSGGLILMAKEQIGESTIMNKSDEEEENIRAKYGLKSKCLPLSTVIEILKQKTGNEDIHEGNLRTTILDMYKNRATAKLKIYVEKVLNQVFHRKEPLPENGILLSGCQSDQVSEDCVEESEDGEDAYGAFTNAVLTIIEECGGEISNRELVVKAREVLEREKFEQRPGLYCSDQYVDAPFT